MFLMSWLRTESRQLILRNLYRIRLIPTQDARVKRPGPLYEDHNYDESSNDQTTEHINFEHLRLVNELRYRCSEIHGSQRL